MEKSKKSIEMKFKTYSGISQECNLFNSRIIVPAKGSLKRKKTLPLENDCIFAIKKEFDYGLLKLKVIQIVDPYENEISFEISGKNKEKIYSLIKKEYKSYQQLN